MYSKWGDRVCSNEVCGVVLMFTSEKPTASASCNDNEQQLKITMDGRAAGCGSFSFHA